MKYAISNQGKPMIQKSSEALSLSINGASSEVIDEVVEISKQIFPGPVSVVREFDPSEPDFPWLTFCVEASGSHQLIFDREERWHNQISRLMHDQPGIFRLNVSLTS
jgi:hypothetical protein